MQSNMPAQHCLCPSSPPCPPLLHHGILINLHEGAEGSLLSPQPAGSLASVSPFGRTVPVLPQGEWCIPRKATYSSCPAESNRSRPPRCQDHCPREEMERGGGLQLSPGSLLTSCLMALDLCGIDVGFCCFARQLVALMSPLPDAASGALNSFPACHFGGVAPLFPTPWQNCPLEKCWSGGSAAPRVQSAPLTAAVRQRHGSLLQASCLSSPLSWLSQVGSPWHAGSPLATAAWRCFLW